MLEIIYLHLQVHANLPGQVKLVDLNKAAHIDVELGLLCLVVTEEYSDGEGENVVDDQRGKEDHHIFRRYSIGDLLPREHL